MTTPPGPEDGSLPDVTAAAAPEAPAAADGPLAAPVAAPDAGGSVGTVGPVGKARGPIAVWLLAIVTLGIYLLVWYYKINKEVAAYDRSIQVNPGLAVLSLFVPIVAWVSIYNTGKRIAHAQSLARVPAPVSPGIGLLLVFVFSLYPVYYQAGLNATWGSRTA
ncbi:DUF4234 domain-containing protein [Luteimicrobium subarcticum]|uniref:Uncharacterized protein DUF4234 n=1 Tax=Luteimicrobium subarcticum TaxID=620910 RepID=A0A2M8WQS2_9MICO|nr:DUF4234 domain-containing protein [Luteimicrobium subarcticum]PJI93291.1 uncharacterized protein DUF4234 [Luteimicrobium subarcticum]